MPDVPALLPRVLLGAGAAGVRPHGRRWQWRRHALRVCRDLCKLKTSKRASARVWRHSAGRSDRTAACEGRKGLAGHLGLNATALASGLNVSFGGIHTSSGWVQSLARLRGSARARASRRELRFHTGCTIKFEAVDVC
eukprot:2105561-Pleurochrysis_carterae.AAC.3